MPDEDYIDAPPEGLEGWREVWAKDQRYRPTGGMLRRLLRRLGLFLMRVSGEADRQRDFSISVLDLIRDAQINMNSIHAEVSHETRTLINEVVVPRQDALIAMIDRKIESLASRVRDLTNPPASGVERAPFSPSDYYYRRMEDALRGSEEEVRRSARRYLEFAREWPPVIDVGCGRGEFLKLCREEGIPALGIEGNERAVAELQAMGLDVRMGLIPSSFEEFGDHSVGTIVAMHVVEHLTFPQIFSFLVEAKRILKTGGLLAIETPNAASLVASAREFWKDPTHVGPRHEAGLVTLAREIGFEITELRTTVPFPKGDQLQAPAGAGKDVEMLIESLNRLLFGDQNLSLVLRSS